MRKPESPVEVGNAQHRDGDALQQTPDDNNLVARCRQGDEAAFEALYRNHVDRIFRQLSVWLGAGPDAEDAVQQVFIQAFSRIERYDGRAPFSAWLRGIARNIALNSMRSKTRRRRAMQANMLEAETAASASAASPQQQVQTKQEAQMVEAAVRSLPANKQLAFVLYFVEQRDLADVAKELGTSSSTAWARISRARTRVLKSIERMTQRAISPTKAGRQP